MLEVDLSVLSISSVAGRFYLDMRLWPELNIHTAAIANDA